MLFLLPLLFVYRSVVFVAVVCIVVVLSLPQRCNARYCCSIYLLLTLPPTFLLFLLHRKINGNGNCVRNNIFIKEFSLMSLKKFLLFHFFYLFFFTSYLSFFCMNLKRFATGSRFSCLSSCRRLVFEVGHYKIFWFSLDILADYIFCIFFSLKLL